MKKQSGNRHYLRGICIILAALILLTAVELLYSNNVLAVSIYTVSSEKVNGPIRIVFLSDLHGREFGRGNHRLLEKISAQNPDLIAFVGDFFNKDADNKEIEEMCTLIQDASEIAPVYFSMGNHENQFEMTNGYSLSKKIEAAGAIVMEVQYQDLEINGTDVRLGGYMGYYRTPHMNASYVSIQETCLEFAEDFENTNCYKVLLNHIPTNWLDWNYRDKYAADLVLSGHYHGGIVRIPFLERGLYAPYVGWFPPYTKGMFEGEKATCILTTGLAGSYGLPRFFNQPEICVVNIIPSN